MHIIQWALNPWGQSVPIHIVWGLIYVSAIAGFSFLVVHAIWVRYFARGEKFAERSVSAGAGLPAKIARHSLAARIFHWVMAASMLVLLFTAFLPKVGVRFSWVTYHWAAGLVLVASILFHIVHASFFENFGSIWPDRIDLADAKNRTLRALGVSAPPPHRFGKYPFENKLYHLIIVIAGLSVAATGAFMLFRVETPFLARNPYILSDMTWGFVYVLHGLAGVGLIALVTVHIYFALRPEKLAITKSMVFGSMSREHFLEHHDPQRWVVSTEDAGAEPSQAD